ncbi:MAG TPA: hypothetical protein VGY54_26495 [Polyangiaceae bacterium]|nr:hypothetical protein [Polyangiaceae bacterium]
MIVPRGFTAASEAFVHQHGLGFFARELDDMTVVAARAGAARSRRLWRVNVSVSKTSRDPEPILSVTVEPSNPSDDDDGP